MIRRVRLLQSLALTGAFVVAMAGRPARADDYPACAKFENPFAYNQCLATQGPPAHGTRAIAPPEGGDGPRGVYGRPQSSMRLSRNRNGRMVMEFSVGPTATAPRGRRRLR